MLEPGPSPLFRLSRPTCAITVPSFSSGTPISVGSAAPPGPTVFLNVPVLTIWAVPPKSWPKFASVWMSNSAVFWNTAPVPVRIEPVPLHTTVPSFRHTRLVWKSLTAVPLRFRVTPLGTSVVPEPLIVPPVQLEAAGPSIVTRPAPLSVPPERLRTSVSELGASKTCVPPLIAVVATSYVPLRVSWPFVRKTVPAPVTLEPAASSWVPPPNSS